MNYNLNSGTTTYEIFDKNYYNVHDTGSSLGTISNEAFSTNNRNILGSDDRTQVSNPKTNPYSATALLYSIWLIGNNTVEMQGTAFLQGDDIVLTAAHCVYADVTTEESGYEDSTYNPRFADLVLLYFGCESIYDFYEGENYDYYAEAEEINIEYAYFNNEDARHDWALLVINQNYGQTLGWYSRKSNWFVQDSTVFTYGYPGDKAFGTMWQSSGLMHGYDWDFYEYTVDTYHGQSGSPIFETDPNGDVYMVAIHVSGGDNYNKGIKINSLIFAYITSFGSSYHGNYTYEYLSFEILGKSGTTWSIKICNNSSHYREVFYNSKMCFDNDAQNWQNLNNIVTIYVVPYQYSIVTIKENWFATTICCSYIYNGNRAITYANNLNSSNHTLSQHYNLKSIS